MIGCGGKLWADLLHAWGLDHLLSSVVFLCIYSSIHDHTDSHCFLKMLQGNLKETLFAWPDKKSNEMIKKSERILRENQCTYINGNIQHLSFFKGEREKPWTPICNIAYLHMYSRIWIMESWLQILGKWPKKQLVLFLKFCVWIGITYSKYMHVD